MERLSDRHGGDLGTDLFCEANTLLHGLGRAIRPIGRDQDVLEQRGSSPVCGSVDGKIAENHGWVDRGDYTASSPALSSRVGEPLSHRRWHIRSPMASFGNEKAGRVIRAPLAIAWPHCEVVIADNPIHSVGLAQMFVIELALRHREMVRLMMRAAHQ